MAPPFAGDHQQVIVDVTVTGALLATVSEDRTANVWSLPERTGLRTIALDDFGTAVAFSPDGRRLAVSARTKGVQIWDTSTWTHERTLDVSASALAWGVDRLAVAVAGENEVQLYTPAFEVATTLEGHHGQVVDLQFTQDGAFVATASMDQTARIFDAHSGEEKQVYVGHRAGVITVAFTPDESGIVTGSQDDTAWLWDLVTGEPLQQFAGHRGPVTVVQGHASGVVVTAARDGRYRVWSGYDGERLHKVDLDDTRYLDGVLLGEQLLLAGSGMSVVDLGEYLAPLSGSPRRPQQYSPACRQLLECGKALMKADQRSASLEVVRLARRLAFEDSAFCDEPLQKLVVDGEKPAACSP